MAPVFMACRLPLSVLFLFFVFLLLGILQSEYLLVYERQFLLDLQYKVGNLAARDYGGHKTLPPYLSGIPVHLYRASSLPPRQKRSRRHGKAGEAKVCLARRLSISRTGRGLPRSFVVPQRFLDPIDACLVPVAGLDDGLRPRRPSSPRLRRRGVNLRHLRTPHRAPGGPQAPSPARIGLVSARSPSNKTFILRDFFSAHALDSLCLTEV